MPGPTDKGSRKPAAAMSQPIPAGEASAHDDANDEIERIQAKARLQAQQDARANKVAAMLEATHFIYEYSGSWSDPWDWFFDGERQMSVSEYYPALKVAVDKFPYIGDHEKRLIALKKKLLKAHGIKYGYLDGTNLSTLMDQLEG
jgi:hypothetical protein